MSEVGLDLARPPYRRPLRRRQAALAPLSNSFHPPFAMALRAKNDPPSDHRGPGEQIQLVFPTLKAGPQRAATPPVPALACGPRALESCTRRCPWGVP